MDTRTVTGWCNITKRYLTTADPTVRNCGACVSGAGALEIPLVAALVVGCWFGRHRSVGLDQLGRMPAYLTARLWGLLEVATTVISHHPLSQDEYFLPVEQRFDDLGPIHKRHCIITKRLFSR